jgi:hypothetical protein
MKAAKITAKLRDAVPVCLYAEGEEKARYKNIELPDSIKALEIRDFHFDIDAAGWISFRLHFDQGVLPEVMPEPRPLVTREQKRAAKAARQPGAEDWSEPATGDNAPEHPGEPSDDIAAYLPAAEAAPAPGEFYTAHSAEGFYQAGLLPAEEAAPEVPSIRFDVPGKKRGALARAIGEALSTEPVYLNPPSYAYQVGPVTLERDGSLTGELPFGLLTALAGQGFLRAE